MRDKLQKMLAAKEARKAELAEKAKTTEDIQELRDISAELDTLNTEMNELRNMIAEAEKKVDEEEFRSQKPVPQVPEGRLNPMATFAAKEERREEDPWNTVEYRKAFMEFAKTGKVTPELRSGDQPTDAFAGVTDLAAIVPTTILNEIIRELKVRGQVFNRVRKLSVKGGVQVPILSLKPEANWVGESSGVRQKVQAKTSVTFSYHGLEVKVATSLVADTVTLDSFESTLRDLIVEAIVEALDKAIISGDGDGKPLGIVKDDRVPEDNVVTLSPSEITKWDVWKKKVFAKMPLAYKAGAAFYMANGTFESYIDGMVDQNGQPVGRVNYGITNGPQERFGGKEVILVEDDVIAPYDDANEPADSKPGDVIAIYANLNNYVINSNMQLALFRYFDHDTNQWVDKAIMIADGRLLDPHGVVIVRKGADEGETPNP
jgi:HK97 family phage major capsid protein